MSRWQAEVDGLSTDVEIPANATLAEALRHAGVMACKVACAEGNCGACSVLVDGGVRLSCISPAMRHEGATIQTAVSFATGPIAAALVGCGGLQCGFCSPGLVVALHALATGPNPPVTTDELRVRLDANLCRCTGYAQLLQGGLAGIAAVHGDRSE